jgi:hypothetical protein
MRSVRTLSDAWDQVFSLEAAPNVLTEDQRRTLDFFRVTNQLETLLTITEIWPVRVVGTTSSGDGRAIDVTPVVDHAREELAKLLGVPAPAEMMRRLFQKDEAIGRRSAEGWFVFSDEGRLSRREQGKVPRWRFDSYADHPSGPRYRFVHDEPLDYVSEGYVYLRPADLAGSSVLLHRRKRAIDELTSHRVLLDAIVDPTLVKRTTVDILDESENVDALDPSKRAALREIWRAQPFYTLQGPPGTGKTTLVATMSAEQVNELPSAQLLVTAQSHETVENVMGEVVGALADDGSNTVVIRLDSDDEHGTRATAARLGGDLARSALGQCVPAAIRDRLEAMNHDKGPAGAAERAGFEQLVQEGAGITFSTSNSGELARLLESGRRYDWSIVEEAGRAHGFDMALPLQASNRILMIGDQQQLPAFNLAVLDNLLCEPEQVLEALRHGTRFAPTIVERSFVTAANADLKRFAEDCSRWRSLLPFFKTVFDRCEAAGAVDGEIIARRLTHQHRMHPEIADIVSACFYPDLKTADEAAQKLLFEPDPFTTLPGWLPEKRIVFVDIPWVQEVKYARGESRSPRYSSGIEAEAVIDVLRQLKGRGAAFPASSQDVKRATLQVLSPYRAQVNRIRRAVQAATSQGGLPHLSDFEFRGVEGAVGATVDEFQGNQADVIVVSLVRNNHAKRGQGLGFLADGRRLNVLLSRAKRKLVLVGSWSFLLSRFAHDARLPPEDPLADIAKVVRALEAAMERGTAAIVDYSSVAATPEGAVGRGRRHRRRSR